MTKDFMSWIVQELSRQQEFRMKKLKGAFFINTLDQVWHCQCFFDSQNS